MDLARFGLTSRPFRPTPDTQLFGPTPTHAAALSALHEAYAAGEPVVLLDGEPGIGKSVTALKFLEGLDDQTPRLLLPCARFARPAELFQSILFDADLPYRDLTEHELRLAVTDLLLKRLPGERTTVIVLEEAQSLSLDLLEELRLLGNLGSRSTRSLLVVLVALPSLRERLTGADLTPFAQRISTRLRLDALSEDESADYVLDQLTKAGDRSHRSVSEEAITLVASSCHGVPRLLNQAMASALAFAAAAGEKQVDSEAVLAALEQLGLAVEDGADELPMKVMPPVTPRRLHLAPSLAQPMAAPAVESRTAKAPKKRRAS